MPWTSFWRLGIFATACYIVFIAAQAGIDEQRQQYQEQIDKLEAQTTALRRRQRDLQRQLACCDNRAWKEKALIDLMGYVPEGYQKTLFTPIDSR